MIKLIDQKIEDYCSVKSTTPDEVCSELYRYTWENVECPQMLVGPLEASFLSFLIQSHGVKTILEIGTFTGYSALAMASALPPDGSLITLDISMKSLEIAHRFWSKSPHGKKIKSIIGPATESMNQMSREFDLIFIDADKENYLNYLQKSLQLLNPNGIIILDNCLWSGSVINSSPESASTRAIQEVNDFIHANSKLQGCLLPVRDGLFLVRRI